MMKLAFVGLVGGGGGIRVDRGRLLQEVANMEAEEVANMEAESSEDPLPQEAALIELEAAKEEERKAQKAKAKGTCFAGDLLHWEQTICASETDELCRDNARIYVYNWLRQTHCTGPQTQAPGAQPWRVGGFSDHLKVDHKAWYGASDVTGDIHTVWRGGQITVAWKLMEGVCDTRPKNSANPEAVITEGNDQHRRTSREGTTNIVFKEGTTNILCKDLNFPDKEPLYKIKGFYDSEEIAWSYGMAPASA